MDQLHEFLGNMPGWAAAIITILVGLIVAFIVKTVLTTVINKTKLGTKAKTTGGNLGSAIGSAGFWLTLLFFVPATLAYLDQAELARPIEDMFSSMAAFLPKLIGAALVFGIGFVVAKIVQRAATTTLQAAQVDTLASRYGVTNATGSTGSIARAVGTLLFILVIIPVAIAALGILDITAISEPLSDMLQGFLDFIPALIGAAIVLGLAIFIARFASNFVKGFLPTLGFDRSVNTLMAIDDGEGLRFSPSSVAGNLVFLIITVLGLVAAIDILGIEFLSETFGQIVAFGGQLLEAAILIMIGVFLANLIARIMAGVISPRIAEIFRYVAILIFTFLGLSQLDPEGSIIPIAFSALVIGASVAGALAFGIGGKDWAGQVLAKVFPPKNLNGPAPKTASRTTKK